MPGDPSTPQSARVSCGASVPELGSDRGGRSERGSCSDLRAGRSVAKSRRYPLVVPHWKAIRHNLGARRGERRSPGRRASRWGAGRAAPLYRSAMGRIRDDVSAVTVSEPVSGAVQRRQRAPEPRARTSSVQRSRVDPEVLATAQRVRRPGQRLVIVSPTCVRLVNVPSS